jgi:hypothetical protein
VDTFPFLAVLLCAMGSLILVLMAMDLRARKAALARGREQARRLREEQDRALAESSSAYEAKKQALRQDWEKKRDALLAQVHAAESVLADELRQVQERLFKAAGRMEDEQGNLSKLLQRLQNEQSKLVAQRQALAAARKEAAGVSARAAFTDQARAKLVDQLVRLEQALKALKEDRERDAQTYSVIPYLGKHGESRRPMYIECAVSGFVFHPDKLYLGAGTSPSRLRTEIQQRASIQIARMRTEGAKDTRPYIMLLVRPDGIHRYYQAQAVLRDLSLEFGYEFVDANWILKVPVDGPPSTSQLVNAPSGGPLPAIRSGPGFLGSRSGPGGPTGGGSPTGGALSGGPPYGGSGGIGTSGSGPGGGGTGTGLAGFGGPPGKGSPAGFGGPPGTANTSGGVGRPGTGSPGGFAGASGTGSAAGFAGPPGAGGSGSPGGSALSGNTAAGTGWPAPAGTIAGGSGIRGIPVVGAEGPGLGAPISVAQGSGRWGSQPGTPGGSRSDGGTLVGGPGNTGSGQPGVRVGLGQPGTYGGSPTGGTPAGGPGSGESGQSGAHAGLGPPSSRGSGPYQTGPAGAPSVGGGPALNPLGLRGDRATGSASTGVAGSSNPLGMQSGNPGGGSGSGSAGGAGTPGEGSGTASAGGPQVIGDPATAGQPAGTASSISPEPKGSPLAFVSSGPASNSVAPPSDALPPSTPPPPPNGNNSPPRPRNNAVPGPSRSADGTTGGSSGGPPGAPRIGSAEREGAGLTPSRIVDVPQLEPEAPPLPRSKPMVLRPARVGSEGEYIIFIECRAEYAVVYPSQRRVAIDALNHSRFHNPLYKTVEQMITRRISTLQSGEKEPRIQIRFLVHPDGDRTMHLAYPVLEVLPGEKIRYNLQPEDDVARLISAY